MKLSTISRCGYKGGWQWAGKATKWLQNVAIKKIPVRESVSLPKGWAIAYCLGHRPMAVGAALASCGFQHHPPAVRFIYRAPRLRAVGVLGVGLTDSRGSALFLGLPTPRPVCDLIIPHNRRLVKHFFIFFWPRQWGEGELSFPVLLGPLLVFQHGLPLGFVGFPVFRCHLIFSFPLMALL